MKDSTLTQKLVEIVEQLPDEDQQKVFEFAKAQIKSSLKGVAGKNLLRFAGTIEPNDILSISQAIEEGCEKVNDNEW